MSTLLCRRLQKGGRRKGRQKKRWEDNIKEWMKLELRYALRKAEDKEESKAVVRRSSAAPRNKYGVQKKFRISIQEASA